MNIVKSIYSLIYTLFFVLLCAIPQSSKASHDAGGNITYRCLGGNQYEITLELYRDCQGIPFPVTTNINIASGTCIINSNLSLPRISIEDVSLICPGQVSSCAGGTLPGYEVHTYQTTTTLAGTCPDWVFSYSSCCRYSTITNSQNPGSSSIYFESRLNNSSGACNDSPQFLSPLLFYACINQPYNISHSVIELDGDSIVYRLAEPLSAATVPITYTAPYTLNYPFSTTTTSVSFDTTNGQLSFTPDIGQIGLFDIIATEYRNGVLVGEVRRAGVLNVINCGTNQPVSIDEVISVNDQGNSVSQGLSTEFNLCAGSQLEFWLRVSDPDVGDSIYLNTIQSSIQSNYPNAVVQTYYPNAGSFDSCWIYVRIPQVTSGFFTIGVSDNACIIPSMERLGFKVNVSNSCASLRGRVVADTSANCIADVNEFGVVGAILHLTDGANDYYTVSNDSGYYSMSVDTGNYTLSIRGPHPIWQSTCQNNIPIVLSSFGNSIVTDFALDYQGNCPIMQVDVSTARLTPCQPTTYALHYANIGVDSAYGAELVIEMDSFLNLTSSSLPISAQQGRQYRFNLGNMRPMQKEMLFIDAFLSCDASVPDRTHCVHARISPDTFCYNHPTWDGIDLEVKGACDPDSVRFTIKNKGLPIGAKIPLIIVEDDIIFMLDSLGLGTGDSIQYATVKNGSTWRLETGQGNGHPWSISPAATLEGCVQNSGDPFSTGFVNLFPEDDAASFISFDCQQNQTQWTLSDKKGFPQGYAAAHYIRQGQSIEYHIRFQNTTTDTIFQVLIRDSLAAYFDIMSIEAGASSHPYTWRIIGENSLEVRMDNVNIPNGSTNELSSHGFVKFRIRPNNPLPLGTVVENEADIYFNYQEGMRSPLCFHTIGENFILSGLETLTTKDGSPVAIQLFPNPMTQSATLQVSADWLNYQELEVELFDALGRRVQQLKPSNHGQFLIERAGLNAGVYYFRVMEKGRSLGSGKLIVH